VVVGVDRKRRRVGGVDRKRRRGGRTEIKRNLDCTCKCGFLNDINLACIDINPS
jgi:hypothetical protein